MGIVEDRVWFALDLASCARAACGLGWLRACISFILLRESILVSYCFGRRLSHGEKKSPWFQERIIAVRRIRSLVGHGCSF